MKSYAELLKSPPWQKKRLEMLEASGWSCDNCGNDKETLNVHHRVYIKGRKPWEYDASQLQVLCQTCHKTHHEVEGAFKLAVADSSFCLMSIGAGFLDASMGLPEESEIICSEGCPDMLDAGRVANLFFYAKRETKLKAIMLLLEGRQALSPIEEGLIYRYTLPVKGGV